MKILVCENNEILLKAIEGRLKLEGHDVITTMNGREAYNFLEKEKVDVLITDILIPFISGLELIFFIRNKFKYDFPIIILSKLNNMDTIKYAYRLGADEYITKPFDPDWLEVQIKKAMINKSLNNKEIKVDISENRYSLS